MVQRQSVQRPGKNTLPAWASWSQERRLPRVQWGEVGAERDKLWLVWSLFLTLNISAIAVHCLLVRV